MVLNEKLDILALINTMREQNKDFRFTCSEQLFFYEILFQVANQGGEGIIFYTNDDMCSILNVDARTLRRARNKLILAKLITYEAGRSKREVGKYKLIIPVPIAPPLSTASEKGLSDVDVPNQTPNKKFTIPSLEEVQAYCRERNNGINAQNFIDFYSAKGWMIGKNKMKDWKAAIRTWEQSKKKNENRSDNSKPKDYNKGF